jgi:hypothetical protein
MDRAARSDAMEPSVAVERRRIGEFQDELDIGPLSRRRLTAAGIAELCSGPLLPLVFAEVLNDKRADVHV